MGQRVLYEINTRCWLRELAELSDHPVSLANVPESEFLNWSNAGFTHVWLMGVWSGGPKGTAAARSNPHLVKRCLEVLPGCSLEDIGASPYAISGYTVAPELGGEEALRVFRARLHQYGLKLVLDFIPNHLGLDHPFVARRPDLFVQGRAHQEGFFPAVFSGQTYWLAHGRDPYFPPWEDTVQLDYRLCETRAEMVSQLNGVAERCDGVRCDMAMLVLKKVFLETWANSAPVEDTWNDEFWASAIQDVKRQRHDFEFIAEVYWGLERDLCKLGFDFGYDKELYDQIVNHDGARAFHHISRKSIADLSCGVHFLENHDEQRASSVLTIEEHRAAALLNLSLPGLSLIHEGQLQGRRVRAPVQLLRRPKEPDDECVMAMYSHLLSAIRNSRVGKGKCRILSPEAIQQGPSSVFLISWEDDAGTDLVLVNLSASAAKVTVQLPQAFKPGSRTSAGKDDTGLFEVSGYEAQILSLRSS